MLAVTGEVATLHTERPRGHRVAPWLWAAVPLAVTIVAYRHRESVGRAVRLIAQARPGWLLVGVLAIGGVYFCRSRVYAVPLQLLRFNFPRRFLWSSALVATSVHQVIPSAGASGYAFLTWALHQRGVPTGQASLIALIDTLCYSIAIATLVVASLLYLLAGGAAMLPRLALGVGPGLALVGIAAYLYALQRDRRRFVPLVLRLHGRIGRLLGRRWPSAPVRRFLDEYYAAKAVVGRRPAAFARMIALQFLSIGFDGVALYAAFLALGLVPHPWVALMGFVLAMAGVAVVAVPAGGGSFEVVMAAFFATHGLTVDQAIAASLLYRVAAFWVPVLVSVVLLFRLRRRRREIRPAGPPQATRSPTS